LIGLDRRPGSIVEGLVLLIQIRDRDNAEGVRRQLKREAGDLEPAIGIGRAAKVESSGKTGTCSAGSCEKRLGVAPSDVSRR
jgi:hypothetical protein